MMDLYNRRVSVQWVCGLAFFTVSLVSMIYFMKEDYAIQFNPYTFIGTIVMLLTSVPILINSKIKASLAASLMSISYGTYLILTETDAMILNGDGWEYYWSILMLLVGAAMALFGLGLLLGYNFNSERLRYTSFIGIGVIGLSVLLEMRFSGFTPELWMLIRISSPDLIFFTLMLLVINSPEIRFYSAYNRLLKNVIYIREVFSVAKDSWIYRNDFKRLVNYENEEWTPVGGPIKEEQVYVIHIYKATLRLIIQRWENGTVRLKVAQNRTDVIMDKINMQLTEIIPDGDIENCESFTIFGTEGAFIRLLVRDDKDTRKAKKRAEKLMKEIEPEFESGED